MVLHWVGEGIRIFRVDNPHTKPFDFWHWLIAEVKTVDPDVLFLAEAFTRPAIMHGLGKIGFTQSYTYFTWRTTAGRDAGVLRGTGRLGRLHAAELLAEHPGHPARVAAARRPADVQDPGGAGRAALPSWGMYAGFELFEHVARPGAEEYLDNEKYELRPRDWAGAQAQGRSLAPFVATLNRVRREQPGPAPAAQPGLPRHRQPGAALLVQARPGTGNTVIVVCSFDSHTVQWGNTTLDMPALGFDWHERFTVHDELTGASYEWGQRNAVRLDPYLQPAHVLTVRRPPTPAEPMPAGAEPAELTVADVPDELSGGTAPTTPAPEVDRSPGPAASRTAGTGRKIKNGRTRTGRTPHGSTPTDPASKDARWTS